MQKVVLIPIFKFFCCTSAEKPNLKVHNIARAMNGFSRPYVDISTKSYLFHKCHKYFLFSVPKIVILQNFKLFGSAKTENLQLKVYNIVRAKTGNPRPSVDITKM